MEHIDEEDRLDIEDDPINIHRRKIIRELRTLNERVGIFLRWFRAGIVLGLVLAAYAIIA
jgi:hypothetical protein